MIRTPCSESPGERRIWRRSTTSEATTWSWSTQQSISALYCQQGLVVEKSHADDNSGKANRILSFPQRSISDCPKGLKELSYKTCCPTNSWSEGLRQACPLGPPSNRVLQTRNQAYGVVLGLCVVVSYRSRLRLRRYSHKVSRNLL